VKKLILLVEDNESDEKLTLVAFRKSGIPHDIVVVRDGAAALEYLLGDAAVSGRVPLPSLVLLDLNLPKVGGLEVLRRLRSDTRTKLLPIVVLSTSKEEEDVRTSYCFGANGYVRKPVAFEDFSVAAKSLGLYWLQLNETIAPGLIRP
jgi:two-component system response regulator